MEGFIITGEKMKPQFIVPLTVLIALAMVGLSDASIVGIGKYDISSIDNTTVAYHFDNGTWVTNYYLLLNFTLNASANNVSVKVNDSVQTSWVTFVSSNPSDVWVEGSNTTWGGNISFIAKNSGGYKEKLMSESNLDPTSGMNITIIIDYGNALNRTNLTNYVWWVDTLAPWMTNSTWLPVISNGSVNDNVFVSNAIIDNCTLECGYHIFYRPYNSTGVLVPKFSSNVTKNDTWIPTRANGVVTIKTPNCNGTIEGGNFSEPGYYDIQGYALDTAGHYNYSNQNETIIVDILKANTWNLIGALEQDNYTVQKIGGKTFNYGRGGTFLMWMRNHSTAVTYIAKWNATAQGFITHQRDTQTNNETKIDIGDGIYLWSTSDVVLIRHNTTAYQLNSYENKTMVNTTASGGVWQLLGSFYNDRNLSVWSGQDTYGAHYGNQNVSYVSFHNNTNGYYYSYARNFGPTAFASMIIRKGQGIWVDYNGTGDEKFNLRYYGV